MSTVAPTKSTTVYTSGSTITSANRPTLASTDRPTSQVAFANRSTNVSAHKSANISANESTITHANIPTVASVNRSNVLALHKAKYGNSQNTPTPQQLVTYAQTLSQNQQVASPHNNTHSGSSSSTESQRLNQVKSKSGHKLPKRRCSQFPSPSKLGFYSPRSKSILKEAKMKYRIYIATKIAFPTTAQALENAVIKYNLSGDEYATETESEREEIPAFDTGRLQVVSLCAYMHVCIAF
jgi:hypothetical protein